jgi:hypothetical protein
MEEVLGFILNLKHSMFEYYVIELDSNLVYVRSSLHLRIKSRRERTVFRL